MILIAESGSTKTDWIELDSKNKIIRQFSTTGLNPIIMSLEEINNKLSKERVFYDIKKTTKRVFFFGAGCSTKIRKDTIKIALENIFSEADITVDHDMAAAAYASYNNKPVITSIIGTGSNSCFFDGKNIISKVPALGYILGDEASGTYFGKYLIRSRYYNELPEELEKRFDEKFELNLGQIIAGTYNDTWPNKFLASFMPFIIENKDHPFLNRKIKEGFREFIRYFIKPYMIDEDIELSYIGSIASLLSKELDEVSLDMGIPIGKKLQWPIEELARYIVKYNL